MKKKVLLAFPFIIFLVIALIFRKYSVPFWGKMLFSAIIIAYGIFLTIYFQLQERKKLREEGEDFFSRGGL